MLHRPSTHSPIRHGTGISIRETAVLECAESDLVAQGDRPTHALGVP
jgi:hypothetical protein